MDPAPNPRAGTPAAPSGACHDLITRLQIDTPPGRTTR